MLQHVVAVVVVTLGIATQTKANGCEVSGRVEVPWEWPGVSVGLWVPPEPQVTPENSTPILQAHVTFADSVDPANHDPTNHDLLLVYRSFIVLSQARAGKTENQSKALDRDFTTGWHSLALQLAPDYQLLTKDEVPLFRFPLDRSVRRVVLEGSNVTVDCSDDWYVWRVEGRSAAVPLTPGGSQRFAIYSNHPVTPTLVLAGERFGFVRVNGDRVVNDDLAANVSLAPFVKHEFRLECSMGGGDVTCTLKNSTSMQVVWEVGLKGGEIPLSAAVEGAGQPLFFLLLQVTSSPAPPLVTTPDPIPVTTRYTPAHHSQGMRLGWSGYWVVLAVVLAFLLCFVILMCVLSHYHRPRIQKYFDGFNRIADLEGGGDVEENEPLVESRLPSLLLVEERSKKISRSTSIVNTEDPATVLPLRLWNAVASGEREEVAQVLVTLGPDPEKSLEGWATSPYQEAHHRGHYQVLRTLEEFMEKEPEVPHSDLVLSVLQSHTRNVEEVFEAARGGQYRYTGGVDVLLRAHSLPGTLQDRWGFSLLHYAASVKLADGGPLWLATDIRSLVENHQVFVNAVDYRGRTALHALAEAASTSERNTCWDGKALSVHEAWVSMATLVLRLGCDPRVPDHKHHYPDHTARQHGNTQLAHELHQAARKLGEISSLDKMNQFKDFSKASRYGDVAAMQRLLMEGVSVLPLGARTDPLLEAIQGGHRDAVFLLLSAGAPLCAQGLVGNTPFEAAHSTKGLPALLPALIRKAFINRMEAEVDMLVEGCDDEATLRAGLERLMSMAENSGHRLEAELKSWFKSRANSGPLDYTSLLAKAAGKGLTLTCQLLGVAGVRLNALPDEVSPLTAALRHHHHHTAYALCRDLGMNPYNIEADPVHISERLATDLLDCELIRFERKLQKVGLDNSTAEGLLEYARSVKDKARLKEPSKTFLYLLAELSLVTTLHRLRRRCRVRLDDAVHDSAGANMLHVAAAYGKTNMVEYLLSQGANHAVHTASGLTAVQLAATRGHRDTVAYITQYTGETLAPGHVLDPDQILKDFQENVRTCRLDVLATEEAMALGTLHGNHLRAKFMLARRCDRLGIHNKDNLAEVMGAEQHILAAKNYVDMKGVIQEDVKTLLRHVAQSDARFAARVVSFDSKQKTEFFVPDEFEFYIESDSYHALNGGCISVFDKNSQEAEDSEEIMRLSSTQDPDLFLSSRFKDVFYRAVQAAIPSVSLKSLALVPPFLTPTYQGLALFALYHGGPRAILVRVSLTPVLKVPVPCEHQLRRLPQRLQHLLEEKRYEHLANTSEGTWVYLFNYMHNRIVATLAPEELRVLQTCIFFCRLLKVHWWLPKREQRRYGCVWQTSPLGMDVPGPRTILNLFLEQLVEEGAEQWGRECVLEKAVAVLRRAPKVEKCGGSLKASQRKHPIVVGEVRAIMTFLKDID